MHKSGVVKPCKDARKIINPQTTAIGKCFPLNSQPQRIELRSLPKTRPVVLRGPPFIGRTSHYLRTSLLSPWITKREVVSKGKNVSAFSNVLGYKWVFDSVFTINVLGLCLNWNPRIWFSYAGPGREEDGWKGKVVRWLAGSKAMHIALINPESYF